MSATWTDSSRGEPATTAQPMPQESHLARSYYQILHHGLHGVELGRGAGVGLRSGVGVGLGVTIGVAVGVGRTVPVGVGVGVGVAVGVGVGGGVTIPPTTSISSR